MAGTLPLKPAFYAAPECRKAIWQNGFHNPEFSKRSTRSFEISRSGSRSQLINWRRVSGAKIGRRHGPVVNAVVSEEAEVLNGGPLVRILMLVSSSTSPYGPAWSEVMQHIGQRLEWTNARYQATLIHESDLDSTALDITNQDALFSIGITNPDAVQAIKTCMKDSKIKLHMCLDSSDDLSDSVKLGDVWMKPQGVLENVLSALPWLNRNKVRTMHDQVLEIWGRRSSEDMVFTILFSVNEFVTDVGEIANQTGGLSTLQCMLTNCRQEVVDCFLDPQCSKALDCLTNCGLNDQVCSYRCIVSYESPLFEKFSLCILQKHNCLGNYAERPTMPNPEPLRVFRGEEMTFETAQSILIGWLGEEKWSWRVVCGKNAAYDYFPCQYQLYYKGRAKGSMWYDPVFKVITLDGREVWRRRHYRVRRGETPSTFYYTVLDNGVTSDEYWTIIDVTDDLSWALFYYSGAASAAGISYTGAVLGTPSGEWPSVDQMPRLERALEKAGIKMWELSPVDNSCCDDAPLDISKRWASKDTFELFAAKQ